MTHKLVAIRKDGGTFVMTGDSEAESAENQALAILPKLLGDGWRISALNMTASAAVNEPSMCKVTTEANAALTPR